MCPALENRVRLFLQKKIDEMECRVVASMGSKCVSVCCPSPRLQSRAIGLNVHGAADSRKLRLKWRKIGSGKLFRASIHNGNRNRISRFFDAAPDFLVLGLRMSTTVCAFSAPENLKKASETAAYQSGGQTADPVEEVLDVHGFHVETGEATVDMDIMVRSGTTEKSGGGREGSDDVETTSTSTDGTQGMMTFLKALELNDAQRTKTSSHIWEWRHKWHIHYQKAVAEPWAAELVYSVDLWREQVQSFVDQVIGEPVYVIGNSLGGYVGTYFAATSSNLVQGIVLMNATPFWSFMPNAQRFPLLAKLIPWAGLLPVPGYARTLTQLWWNLLRKPQTIQSLLELVYKDHSALSDNLVDKIVEATDHPAAGAAFASILFAPKAYSNFTENLIRLRKEKVSLCLIYGREDPWVVPFWGQRVKQHVPDAVYYELSPVGHCPHHEAPEVVNFLIRKWVQSISQGSNCPALLESMNPYNMAHQFVVRSSTHEAKERQIVVHVKPHQNFIRDFYNWLLGFMMKQRSQPKI
ncbi:hypothetical protein CY35_13G050300 [Sphagnum magellanicum]|nr:hypothetical protein CY35_13G050300 [Sphagnum magellanicum]